MKKTNKKLFILLLMAVLAIGSLFVFALYTHLDENEYDQILLVRTETIYIILTFAIILLVTLFSILRLLRKKRRIIKRKLKLQKKAKIKNSLPAVPKRPSRRFLRKQKKHQLKMAKKLAKNKGAVDLSFTKDGLYKKEEEHKIIVENIYNNDVSLNFDEELNDDRFYMLTKIDLNKDEYININYDNNLTLESICNDFRNFAAHKLKLYYDIEDIRRFIGGLAVTHILILQGMSGTGKTSLAYAFGEFINNSSVIVPVQPMWKERTDMIGYYNEFTKKFNETILLQKLYEANYSKSMYITVLDEINIARIEYYFAEFLSLLELPDYNKRNLDVIANKWETDPKLLDNGQIVLPFNMWFIGTANNDESTFAISDKVYDRAMVLNLDKKAVPFIVEESNIKRIDANKFNQLVKEAQLKYQNTNRNLRRIKELDRYLIKNFQITFGNRIMQQILNYIPVIVASGGTELEAIDDILSKKVLRKLESKNLAYVKSSAPALVSFIEDLFGEDGLKQCTEYVTHIEKNV